MPCILSAWCTDTTVYGHYAFCKIKYKYGDQTDNCDYNFNAVDNSMHGLITRGQFWPSGIVVASVCLSVCLCVRQSLACPRDNLSPVQARITKFGPEEQNTLVKIPIFWGVNWPCTSRSNLT